jgi:hypothetical protein
LGVSFFPRSFLVVEVCNIFKVVKIIVAIIDLARYILHIGVCKNKRREYGSRE